MGLLDFDMEDGLLSFAGLISEDEIEKESKKKPEKKAEKKRAAAEKTGGGYKLPLTVHLDSGTAIRMEGEGTVSKDELFQRAESETGCGAFRKKECFELIKLSENGYLIRPLARYKVMKSTEGSFVFLENQLVDATTIAEPKNGFKAEAANIMDALKEQYGFDMDLYLVGDTYFPVPKESNSREIEAIKLPAIVCSLTTGEKLELSMELYQSFLEEEKRDGAETQDGEESEEESEEEESGDMEESQDGLREKVVLSCISMLLPDYKDCAELFVNVKTNTIFVSYKKPGVTGSIGSTTGKQGSGETYASDSTISLLFTKIPLSPNMFDGREQITTKDVLRILQRSYPEFSAERTEIRYDAKKKLIMPILKSGKRGAGEYQLTETEGFRHEDSPIMDLMVEKDGERKGSFRWKLPPIPFTVLKKILIFFWDVYVIHGTEALAQIFYDTATSSYMLHIPTQRVTSGNVEFERNVELEHREGLYLVMEIHSHGRHQAFWSGEDNANELSHCLYGVVGDIPNFTYTHRHIILRAGTGGYFLQIAPFSVFEKPRGLLTINPYFSEVYVEREPVLSPMDRSWDWEEEIFAEQRMGLFYQPSFEA